MLDTLNLARMMQKFISKKKSVGYSQPPIWQNGEASFRLLDHEGNAVLVTVREITLEEELEAATNNKILREQTRSN